MIRSSLLFLLAIFLLMKPFVANANGDVKVGDTIPHNLTIKDSTGKMRSFSDLTGKKGLILVFIRSAEWCPFCQKQLIELSKNNKKFTDAGYKIASISYDALPQLKKFITTNKPNFTMLSDPASETIRAFGILNENSAKGTMSYGIPHPGVYIISKDKKVQAKFFKEGYKERPSINELVAKIKEINPPSVPVYESLDEMGEDPILPEDAMIETPEKILDPIIIPEDFDPEASGETLKEITSDVLDPEALAPEVIQAPPIVEETTSEMSAPKTPPDINIIAPEEVVLPEEAVIQE